jgi:hypothetical protein
LRHTIIALLPTVPFITLQLDFIEKNLSFFDYSPYVMLYHGLGEWITRMNPHPALLALQGSAGAAACFICLHLIYKSTKVAVLLMIVVASSLVGLFGYFALLAAFPVAIVLAVNFLTRSGLKLDLSIINLRQVNHHYLIASIALTFVILYATAPRDWNLIKQRSIELAAIASQAIYPVNQNIEGKVTFLWSEGYIENIYPNKIESFEIIIEGISNPELKTKYTVNNGNKIRVGIPPGIYRWKVVPARRHPLDAMNINYYNRWYKFNISENKSTEDEAHSNTRKAAIACPF